MDVSRTIFSSHGNGMQNLSEEQLLLAISTCCVTKQTLRARVGELYKTKQNSGQTVLSFLSALKMKARQCDWDVGLELAILRQVTKQPTGTGTGSRAEMGPS